VISTSTEKSINLLESTTSILSHIEENKNEVREKLDQSEIFNNMSVDNIFAEKEVVSLNSINKTNKSNSEAKAQSAKKVNNKHNDDTISAKISTCDR